MEEIRNENPLGRHGLREDRLLEAFFIGGSATSDLKPGLTPADSEVVVGEGMQKLADQPRQDPAG